MRLRCVAVHRVIRGKDMGRVRCPGVVIWGNIRYFAGENVLNNVIESSGVFVITPGGGLRHIQQNSRRVEALLAVEPRVILGGSAATTNATTLIMRALYH